MSNKIGKVITVKYDAITMVNGVPKLTTLIQKGKLLDAEMLSSAPTEIEMIKGETCEVMKVELNLLFDVERKGGEDVIPIITIRCENVPAWMDIDDVIDLKCV